MLSIADELVDEGSPVREDEARGGDKVEVVRNRKEAHRAILACLQFLKSIESTWLAIQICKVVEGWQRRAHGSVRRECGVELLDEPGVLARTISPMRAPSMILRGGGALRVYA